MCTAIRPPSADYLTVKEIVTLASTLVNDLGVDKIRLTGGEPTVVLGTSEQLWVFSIFGFMSFTRVNYDLVLSRGTSGLYGIAMVGFRSDPTSPKSYRA